MKGENIMETIQLNLTFKNDMGDTWLVQTPMQLEESKKEDFRKEINQALDKVGFYNPFTLKAVVDGKGNVKILFYNIERYSKKEIDTIFHTIDKTYTQWYKISL